MEKTTSAIIETGGKQYSVTPGQTIDVEKLPAAVGETVELNRVLMVNKGYEVVLGTPTVEGARVFATVAAEGKGDKVTAFKYKNKVRYRRKKGHRQLYTRLTIGNIETR